MSTQHTSSTGPSARARGYSQEDVRMRVADLVGAYHLQEYRGMQTHALSLTGLARRLGADRNVEPREIEDVPTAASQIVDAWENGRANKMAALALGLLDVAREHKRGGA